MNFLRPFKQKKAGGNLAFSTMCKEDFHVKKGSILLVFVFLFLFFTHVSGQSEFFHRTIGSIDGPTYLETADMDGDGDNDVVVSAVRANQIVWYRYPDWQAETIISNWQNPYISVGDMDSDGDFDVVATSWSNDIVAWFENPGWTQHTIDDDFGGACGVYTIDMDGDDTTDVVVSGYTANAIVWYEGPNFLIQHSIASNIIASPLYPDNIFFYDIDEDKDQDLFLTTFHDPLIFSLGSLVFFENINDTAWNKIVIDDASGWILSMDFGDPDNDGSNEIVAGLFGHNRVVMYDYPSWSRSDVDPSLPVAAGVGISDIDTDGYPDIVASGQLTTNPLRWYEGPDWTMYPVYEPSTNFHYLKVLDLDNDKDMDIVVSIIGNDEVAWFRQVPVGIDVETINIPDNFVLMQNYPNPFNPKTVIRYALPVTCHLELSIYNILGQEVATIVNQKLPAGEHTVQWDANAYASGVYYYRLEAGDIVETRKMVLLK